MARKTSAKEQTGDTTKTQPATAKKSGRGGRRPGAGRKPKWGGKTVVMRVPESMVDEIQAFIQAKVDSVAVERRVDDGPVMAAQRVDASILKDAVVAEPVGEPAPTVPELDRADDTVHASPSAASEPQKAEAADTPPQPPKQKRKTSRAKSKSTISENQLTLFDFGF